MGTDKTIPKVLSTCRMVNMPKEAKLKNEDVGEDETSPLPIYSVVWRTYMGAWYKSGKVQGWIKPSKGVQDAQLEPKHRSQTYWEKLQMHFEMMVMHQHWTSVRHSIECSRTSR